MDLTNRNGTRRILTRDGASLKKVWLEEEKKNSEKMGRRIYKRLVGEVEARNADRRNRTLNSYQKKQVSPLDTEDVSREEQIIKD